MNRALQVLAAAGVTAALAGLIALGSSFALPSDPPSEGLLRLDWRVRGEEAGGCIRPTEEELEDLPAHMRNPDACVGELPAYRLSVWVDGERKLDQMERAGGVRGDRPLTVYEEVHLTPGSRQIRIEFAPEEGALEEAAARETAEQGDEDRPVRLATEGTLDIEAGRVLLAVRRQDTGALVLRVPVR